MSNLSQTVADGLAQIYRDFGQRVRTLSEQVSEEQFWTNPFSHGNSMGHLVLHLTGNLSYYIGAEIARSGYVRDREREFTDAQPPSKEEALQRLEAAVQLVIRTLEAQTPDTWSLAYSVTGVESWTNRFQVFLRCAAHFQSHLGQMIYLVKAQSK